MNEQCKHSHSDDMREWVKSFLCQSASYLLGSSTNQNCCLAVQTK